MREIDKLECKATGREPIHALEHGIRSSLWSFTAISSMPVAIIGVFPVNITLGAGIPWMLGTEEVYDRGRELLTYGPKVVSLMHRTFDRLENIVSADNDRAIRLLRKLGFTVEDERVPVGGIDFVRFASV